MEKEIIEHFGLDEPVPVNKLGDLAFLVRRETAFEVLHLVSKGKQCRANTSKSLGTSFIDFVAKQRNSFANKGGKDEKTR